VDAENNFEQSAVYTIIGAVLLLILLLLIDAVLNVFTLYTVTQFVSGFFFCFVFKFHILNILFYNKQISCNCR